ncbi:MAG: chemotaxis response regulator protein-glutamate methylesterase [Maritimibacter sp.]|nr:chemotaxis response regulator protein-glutamate methylesterase [Maritimibacter sp.]
MNDRHHRRDRRVRVLIVDDSPTMRKLIRAGLAPHPQIEVIGEAGNAREARDAVKALQPDVMTLDVEMPGMSGIEFLERLMRGHPMPVIMFSTLTGAGTDASIKALSLGAVDCLEKPRFGAAVETFAHLTEMLLVAADAQVRRPPRAPVAAPAATASGWRWNGRWVLIGSSTGGVEALETVLRNFPADGPPTLITQHMPAQFLRSFAARLNATVAPTVRIAADGDRPAPGCILIAPGDDTHLRIAPDGVTIQVAPGPKRSGHRPSVDEMFGSAVPLARKTIAAILTGMGRDGAAEMLNLRRAGAVCIGQDAASCVVYGMPRVAYDLGAVAEQVPLERIGARLLELAAR